MRRYAAAMDGGPTSAGGDDENVVVTSGDVTSIGDSATGGEPVATGGTAIAASLTTDPDVLNIAFTTGSGDVQFLQIPVADLLEGDATSTDGDVVVAAELTALGGDVIDSGGGAATPVGSVAVAASLSVEGDLNLSFVDGNGHLQLIEANVAQLLQGPGAAHDGAASPAESDSAQPGL
ncbi:MAG: hypothetical protein QOI64_1048 [Solirubrobacteraceae bacterium]|nr:hypothetical protein [Solirubrobacteraceae bacterium]